MDLKKIIKDYLQEARVMQVATVKDGKPWICTLNFSADNQWHLFWVSHRSTRHSQEIRNFPEVAGTIVKDLGTIQGIQFEGLAEEISGNDVLYANEVFTKRYGDNPERLAEAQSTNESQRAFYKITVTRVVLFDKVNFPDNPRQEITL